MYNYHTEIVYILMYYIVNSKFNQNSQSVINFRQ